MEDRNPRADRRLEVGLALLAEQRPAAAARAIEAALEIHEAFSEAWFALGEAREKAGHRRKAAAAYRRYLALDAADAHGAALRLGLLGARSTPARPPEAYLRRLFDEYAPRFDAALVGRLGYDAPAALAAAVAEVTPAGAPPRRILDLGCGTGLCAPLFREGAVWLEGVDLSPGMVARARARKLYDALVVEEAGRYLARVRPDGEDPPAVDGEPAGAPRPFDLIVAADVLVYLGDLSPLLRSAGAALVPGGLFAFTLERGEAPGFELQASQRYAHHPTAVAAQAAAAGLDTLSMTPLSYRLEAGRPVPGLLVRLRRPGPAAESALALPAPAPRGRPSA